MCTLTTLPRCSQAATAMMEGWVRLCDPESREGLESRLRRLREVSTSSYTGVWPRWHVVQ